MQENAMQEYDFLFDKFVGYQGSVRSNLNYDELWSERTFKTIQQKVLDALAGLRSDGRPILVTYDVIGAVISQIMTTFRPQIGDIYTRYIITTPGYVRNDVRDIIDRTINIIVSHIRTEVETVRNNKTFSVWDTTLLGDFNAKGVKQRNGIKLNDRRPKLQFMMNY